MTCWSTRLLADIMLLVFADIVLLVIADIILLVIAFRLAAACAIRAENLQDFILWASKVWLIDEE